jgi:hypothetical protein
VAVEDNAQLKLVQEINMLDAVVAVNVFYVKCDFVEGQPVDDVLDACETWIVGLYTAIIAQIRDTVTMGDLTVYEYDTILDQWDNIGSRAPTVVFTNATEMLPHGVAALVRAYTEEARTVGRKYLPAFCEDRQEDGAWIGATITALTAFGVAWSTSEIVHTSNELLPAVFSTKWKTVRLLSGTEVVLTDPAYQRRRRPGVGM